MDCKFLCLGHSRFRKNPYFCSDLRVDPILEVKKRTLPQIWNLQNMEIFIISTTLYRRFTREIPNELNEYNVFGENNLRHFEEQISQP